MGNTDPNKDIDYDYGIIAVKTRERIEEKQHLNPITMMRNALGTDQGGSGHGLDK